MSLRSMVHAVQATALSIGVSSMAFAAQVTENTTTVPDGAANLWGMADNAMVSYGVPLLGVGMLIDGGLAFRSRGNSGGEGSLAGPIWRMVGGGTIAAAPAIITTTMATLSAAPLGGPLLVPESALFLRDPLVLTLLLVVPFLISRHRRHKAQPQASYVD